MKVAIFIDGGYLRVITRQAGYEHEPDYIEKIAHDCILPEGKESLLRILYYDCAPYEGKTILPVSGKSKEFTGSDSWLKRLSAKPLFAVRLGVLKFRGFVPKKTPLKKNLLGQLSDEDFKPRFEQKGVDMRIGLDIATYAVNRSVERIILITADTDCLPAMKLARAAGLQVVLIKFPKQELAGELLSHSDFQREIKWPTAPVKYS